MQLTYLPAIWPDALSNRWTASPINAMDPRLRGTAGYHPHALTSYGTPAWRQQDFRWEPEVFVFGDSGGYSMVRQGVRLDPRAALSWQLRCCSVGAVLDHPPWTDWRHRRACLAQTVANVKAALPHYLRAREAGTRFRWWGVVHGRTHAELAEWHEAVSRVHPFTDPGEGWAFRPEPLNDPAAVAHVLTFIRRTGMRAAHFFATTGLDAVETLYANGPEAGLAIASVDSTSALFRAFRRILVRPTTCGWESVVERFRDTGGQDTRARDFMLRECPCDSCHLLRDDVKTDRDLFGDEAYLRYRIAFHNLLATLTCYDTLRRRYALAATP
jgi:hypothetical protein